jgi:hypothetical protein
MDTQTIFGEIFYLEGRDKHILGDNSKSQETKSKVTAWLSIIISYSIYNNNMTICVRKRASLENTKKGLQPSFIYKLKTVYRTFILSQWR